MLAIELLRAHGYWVTYVSSEKIGFARHDAAPTFFGPFVASFVGFPCRKKDQSISWSDVFGAGSCEELPVN